MSQLMFDGFVDNKVRESSLPAISFERKESWYKGRTLSHSSIAMYRACPQRWKFKYIDKIPEKPRSFFSFGKSIHAGLEFLFSNLAAIPSLDEVLAHYKKSWLREGYESPQQEKWFYQEGERILRGFYVKHRADHPRVRKVEFHFTVDIEGVPVTGYIDRIDETPQGKLALIDYKTGKAFDKSRVRKESQLTLYQIACRTLLNQDVESVTLYHLNSLTPLTVPAHSKSMEDEMRGVVVDVAKGIAENLFPAKPDQNNHCQYCDYMPICPAFAGRKSSAAPLRKAAASLNELADRFGKLDARIKELNAEKDQLAETLKIQMAQLGTAAVQGQYFAVELNNGPDSSQAPLKSKPLEGEIPS